MREELDDILGFINEATLTDSEWLGIAPTVPEDATDQEKYQALFSVLSARAGEGNATEKLRAYYNARGIKIAPGKTGYSNIIIGFPLE